MIPLRIVETDRDEFDEPVVEIWRDDEFVGMVFWDEDVAVVQVYQDADGDVYDLDLAELLRVMSLAEAIVTPEELRIDRSQFFTLPTELGGPAEAEDDGWDDEYPETVTLVQEFDPKARHRSADGESFYARRDALDFVARCDQLDLAVVEMEGFDFDGTQLRARPELALSVSLPGMNNWRIFRPAANALVQDTLSDWPMRSSLLVAFVVQQPDGTTFVA